MSDYTYSNGYGPRCPYCGAEDYADESHYFEPAPFEHECGDCGREYKVVANITTSWQSYPMKEGESHE